MLAALPGHTVEDSDEDPMLIEQLIAGFSHVYSEELRPALNGWQEAHRGVHRQCLDMILKDSVDGRST